MTEADELSPLQQDERAAMTGDRAAVLRVVSALRQYRAAARELLDARYADGECDRVAMSTFASVVEDIEGVPQ